MLGSIFGKSFNANGRANSIKGINTNILMGTRRKRSDTVLSSCLRSLLVKGLPCMVLPNIFRAVRRSAYKSCFIARMSENYFIDKNNAYNTFSLQFDIDALPCYPSNSAELPSLPPCPIRASYPGGRWGL